MVAEVGNIAMPALFQGDTLKLFSINTITAIAYAFVLPIMSLFLITQLNTPPAYIGFFTVSTAIGSILANQLAGKLIDKGVDAKKLLLVALTALIFSGVLFSQLQHFWQAVIVGLFVFSIGNTCIPILLSIIRRHADRSALPSTELNAQMRSGVSMVWIIAPALSFTFVGQFGFSITYLTCAAIAGVAFILALLFLPSFAFKKTNNTDIEKQAPIALHFWLLGLVVFFGNFANGLYFTAMPLVITQDLNLPEYSVGVLMGITAALEIPAMLLAPRWSIRWGRTRIFNLAFVFGVLYYSLLQFADTLVLLMALQVLNGLFFGIFIGLGISMMQDELPEQVGFASAFHTNAMRVGSMFGSSSAGILAQFLGFQKALLGSVSAVSLAFLVLIFVRFIAHRKAKSQSPNY